jgi:hypothetical protein
MTLLIVLSIARLLPGQQTSPTWLPPSAVDGLAQQLAERLEPGTPPGSALLSRARQQVERVRTTLDGLGEQGVLERTPAFSQLPLPTAGQRQLDAMAHYQVCTMALALQLAESRSDADRHRTAGDLTALTMVVLFLRQRFIDRGHDPESIRSFMVSDRMERAVAGLLKGEPDLRAHVEGKCAPVVAYLGGRT